MATRRKHGETSAGEVDPRTQRRERVERLRRERERERQGRREQLRRRGVMVLVGLALIGIAATVVTFAIRPDRSGDIAGVRSFGGLSQDHVPPPVAYDQSPPVGGDHQEVWLNCGTYDQPVPKEQAVHSLEHGAVWLTFRSDLPGSELEKLRQLVDGHSHAILSPYPDLPAPIMVSAWGKQLQLTDAADLRLPQFIKVYEQGRQTPEPGAPCSGGSGTPVS